MQSEVSWERGSEQCLAAAWAVLEEGLIQTHLLGSAWGQDPPAGSILIPVLYTEGGLSRLLKVKLLVMTEGAYANQGIWASS